MRNLLLDTAPLRKVCLVAIAGQTGCAALMAVQGFLGGTVLTVFFQV